MSKLRPRKATSTNFTNEATLIAGCPLAAAMKLLGGRWKLMVVWYVHHGLRRFSELRRTMADVSEKMLYQQLRELEQDGLLHRAALHPRLVSYELTPLAASLVPTLQALADWSERNEIGRKLLERTQLSPVG